MNADRINELYAGKIFAPETQMRARERIHWICRQARGKRILDIGCSQGIVCLLLAREGFNCVGIDYEKTAIEYALEELKKEEDIVRKRVEFKIGDAVHLSFEDDSFDTVILGEIIEHLNHPEKVLKEAKRVLKDGGMAIITVPFGLNPDPDHKRTYYPVSFLERVQPFFKTDIIDTIDNYIIYCGIKDVSYSISKVSKEALLLESLRLQNKTEERFLLKEQELFAKSKQFNDKVKTLTGQVSSLSKTNKEIEKSATNKERGFEAKLREKDLEYKEAIAVKESEIKDLQAGKVKELADRRREFEAKLREKDIEHKKTVSARESEIKDLQAGKVKELADRRREFEAKLREQEAQFRRNVSSQEQLYKHAWKWRIGSAFVIPYILIRDFIKHPYKFCREPGKYFRRVYYHHYPGRKTTDQNRQLPVKIQQECSGNELFWKEKSVILSSRGYKIGSTISRLLNLFKKIIKFPFTAIKIVKLILQEITYENFIAGLRNPRLVIEYIHFKLHPVQHENLSETNKKIFHSASFEVDSGSLYQLNINLLSRGEHQKAKGGLVVVKYFDKTGSLIKGKYVGFFLSAKFGNFAYLTSSKDGSKNLIIFRTTNEVASLKLEFVAFSDSITSFTDFEFVKEGVIFEKREKELKRQLKEMKEYCQEHPDLPFIVYMATTKKIGEKHRANRPMMIVQEYARLNYPVLYIYYSFDSDAPIIDGQIPPLLQLPNTIFKNYASKIASWNIPNQKLFICSIPDQLGVEFQGVYEHYGWCFVYEVRDDWEEFTKAGVGKWYNNKFEKYLCAKCDKIVTVSIALTKKMIALGASEERTKTIPNATTQNFIDMSRPFFNKTKDANIVGYFGHLTPAWYDWDILISTAQKMPNLQFEIIGYGEPNDLKLPDNITFFGPQSHERIIQIAQNWTVGIIPFKPGHLANGVDPIKLYEYLALGLKVVSCHMAQITRYPLTFTYRDRNDFQPTLENALQFSVSSEQWDQVRKFVDQSTWHSRAIDILDVVGLDHTFK